MGFYLLCGFIIVYSTPLGKKGLVFLFFLQNKSSLFNLISITVLWVFFLKHVSVYKKAAEENHTSYWSEDAVGLNEPQSFPTLNVSSADIKYLTSDTKSCH